MAKEIERKFLVKGEFRHLAVKSINITQAYLSTDPSRIVRLRIAGEKAFFTVKGAPQKNSFSRDEWEIEISSAAANEILTVCIPGTIIKTRYYVPSGAKRTFEVDVFHGRNEGLVIAEIELEHPDEWFEKPGWLGEEVTGKPEYYNSNLI